MNSTTIVGHNQGMEQITESVVPDTKDHNIDDEVDTNEGYDSDDVYVSDEDYFSIDEYDASTVILEKLWKKGYIFRLKQKKLQEPKIYLIYSII